MLEGSDLLIERTYSTYAFRRGLPQKRTKAYKGGRGFKIAEFRAYVLFEWPHIAFTGKNDEILRKYKEVFDGIKNCIEQINNNKSGEYEKAYMKIKFDSDNKLPLNKQLKSLSVTIVIRSVFEDDSKYCHQAFLDDYFYEL